MKHSIFFLITIIISYLNAGYAQMSGKEVRKQKNELKAQEIEQLVASKQFTFQADALTTSSGFYKHLDPHYELSMKSDSAFVQLPYWGRVYMARLNDDGGFYFNGKIQNFKFKNKGKKGYELNFLLQNNGDNHHFTLDITRQGYAYLQVSSTRKSFISYNGIIVAKNEE